MIPLDWIPLDIRITLLVTLLLAGLPAAVGYFWTRGVALAQRHEAQDETRRGREVSS